MSSSFQSIPILDYSLSLSDATKPEFLRKLRHALLEVGFLYIKNTSIDGELIQRVIDLGKAFFELPEEKLRLDMKNCRYCVKGYLAATVCLPGGRNKLICTIQLPIFSATTVSAKKCKYLPIRSLVVTQLPPSELTIQQHQVQDRLVGAN